MAVVVNKMIREGYGEVTLDSVCSRNISRAESFCREFGFGNAYDDLDAMCSDPMLDIVYIASPASEHYEQAITALRNHKAILVEKPFMVNMDQADEVIRLAKEQGVLASEAFWTRYQPLFKKFQKLLEKQPVGQPVGVFGSLCYPVLHKKRVLDLQLAGGAILETGVYALNFADAVFGEVSDCEVSCVKSDTGIDLYDVITLRHTQGHISGLCCSINTMSDGNGIVHCENGYIQINSVNNFLQIRVFDHYKNLLSEYSSDAGVYGYEYEIMEVVQAINDGSLECVSVSHDDSLRMIRLCDRLRKEIGLRYPFE